MYACSVIQQKTHFVVEQDVMRQKSPFLHTFTVRELRV
jgi:hypothetical protein